MAYLNKIKILDGENQTSSTTPFNFGIGTLREDDNGNIVYGPEGAKKVFLAADGNGSYTLEDTVLQEYIDNRDSFLQAAELDESTGILTLSFKIGSGDNLQEISIDLAKILNLHTYQECDSIDALPESAKEGDIAIVKSSIGDSSSLTEKTAYIYDGKNWLALDGNYNAENVYFDQDLIYTADIGVLTLGNAGYKTIESTGKSLKDVMETILKKTIEPTIKRYPDVSLTASCANSGASLEIGSLITSVSYTGSLSEDGDYETNGKETASGITPSDLSWEVTLGDDAATKKTTASDSYTTEIKINSTTENKVYATVKATVTLSLDNVVTPTNNLGEENSDVKIKGFDASGTTTKTLTAEVKATGYRNTWYYVGTDYTSTLNSAFFRTKKEGLKAMNKSTTSFGTVTIPGGTKRVAFAVLGDKTLRSVIDVDGQNLDVKANFTKETVKIEGANGFTADNYTVFHFENENGIAATKYTVTIG